jgi:NADH-quinone oxidoreductase subunit N
MIESPLLSHPLLVESLRPEVTLIVGILLLIIVPNLGKATARIPMTQIRIPVLLGGERFRATSDPLIPGVISMFTLLLAMASSLMTFVEGTALSTVCISANGALQQGCTGSDYILRADAFSRMFTSIFSFALLVGTAAMINRMPANADARAPHPDSSDTMRARAIRRLLNNRRQGDFHLLILFAALGMSIVALSTHLFLLFIGLELASLAIYVLVAFMKEERTSGEAATKYFLTGSVSSAVTLYGMSLLYIWSGSTFDYASATLSLTGPQGLAASWAAMDTLEPLAAIGFGMLLVGFGFKVSAVPFHFAAPDAYSGTSSPMASILATASKAMGFAALLRILVVMAGPEAGSPAFWLPLFGLLSVVTMTWGNLAALSTENPKRMLAYSSVAHAGYLLAAIAAIGSGMADESTNQILITAVIFHLLVLAFFKSGAFLVLTMTEIKGDSSSMESLHGLGRRDPIIAVAMFVFMLALAGVPPLSGFLSKFLVIDGIISASTGSGSMTATGAIDWLQSVHWVFWLAISMALNSALSLFYYLRIGQVMFFEKAKSILPLPDAPMIRITVILCLILTIISGLGPFSQTLVDMATMAAQHLLKV